MRYPYKMPLPRRPEVLEVPVSRKSHIAGQFESRIAERIEEQFGSTWLLLSETTNFLAQTSAFHQYENTLMDFRHRLSAEGRDSAAERQVRKELTEFRALLRSQGYDLSLARLRLSIEGFRNDSSLEEGFSRLVLFIGDRDIWYISGQDNHIELHDQLENLLRARQEDRQILEKHYLWYLREKELLILSGADSETEADFKHFKAWASVPEHRLLLLSRLKSLR